MGHYGTGRWFAKYIRRVRCGRTSSRVRPRKCESRAKELYVGDINAASTLRQANRVEDSRGRQFAMWAQPRGFQS